MIPLKAKKEQPLIKKFIDYKKSFLETHTIDELMVLSLTFALFFSAVLMMVLLLVIFIYLFSRKKLRATLFAIKGVRYLAVFLPLCLIVPLIHQNWQGLIIGIGLCFIVVVALYIRAIMTKRLFEQMIRVACMMSIYCFIVALGQKLTMWNVAEYRSCSTFYNANYYAAIIEFVVIFCVYRFLNSRTRNDQWFYALTAFMNMGGLLLSGCRTALAAIFAAVFIMLLINKRYKLMWLQLALGVICVGALILAPELFSRADTIESSLEVRESIWRAALRGIIDYPLFGRGSVAYSTIARMYGGYMAPHAHNLFLDVLLNFGIVGTVLLAGYLKNCFRPIYEMYNQKRDPKLFSAIFAIIIAVLVHGITDVSIFGLQTGMLLMLVLSSAGVYENTYVWSKASYPYKHVPGLSLTTTRLYNDKYNR